MSEARRTDLRDAGGVLCVPLLSRRFVFSLVMFAYANCTQISKKKITKRFTNAKCKKKCHFYGGFIFVFLHGTAAFFSSAKSSDGGPAVKEYYGLKNEKGKKKRKERKKVGCFEECRLLCDECVHAASQQKCVRSSPYTEAKYYALRSTVYQKSDCDKVKDVMPISKVQSAYATTTKRTDLELGPPPV